MKKQFSLLLVLLVSFSTLFVSCEEPMGDDDIMLHNGYGYVDLGLSVKWATCNVGATQPEEFGAYYAWGEIKEKSDYSWSTYKWGNGFGAMTKYCTKEVYGTVDNKTILDPADDVAHVKWGGNWRMPTAAELNELHSNCTWTWTTINGVNGYRVTSIANGNSIFLPAAGSCINSNFIGSGNFGAYWSSSLVYLTGYNMYSYYYHFYNGHFKVDYTNRNEGRSVRPVCE